MQNDFSWNLYTLVINDFLRLQLIFLVISLSRKRNFLRTFENFREFWRILDISKKNLRAFPGNSGKNFWPYFGNYVAKPSLHANSRSRQSTAKLSRQRNVFHGRNSFPYLGRFSKVQPELKP